jgi:Na+/glutamate symporter
MGRKIRSVVAMIRNFPNFRRRRGAVLLLALAAFWLAQALAVVHESHHVGGDAHGLPGSHTAFCTDCASMLPLLAIAGGTGAAAALVPTARQERVPRAATVAFAAALHPAFRSRAPPR